MLRSRLKVPSKRNQGTQVGGRLRGRSKPLNGRRRFSVLIGETRYKMTSLRVARDTDGGGARRSVQRDGDNTAKWMCNQTLCMDGGWLPVVAQPLVAAAPRLVSALLRYRENLPAHSPLIHMP